MKLKSYLRGLGLGMIVTTLILVLAFQARNKEMTDEEVIARAHELGMVETSLYGSGDAQKETTASDNKAPTQKETSGEGMIDPEGTLANKEETTAPKPEETQSTTKNQNTTTASQAETTKVQETTSVKEETKEAVTTQAPTEKVTEKVTEKQTEKQTEKPTEKETEKQTEKPTEKETETTKPQETKPQNEVITLVFEDISTADKASRILYEAGIIQSVDNFNAYLSEQGLATKVGEGEFQFTKGMSFEEIAKIITRQR